MPLTEEQKTEHKKESDRKYTRKEKERARKIEEELAALKAGKREKERVKKRKSRAKKRERASAIMKSSNLTTPTNGYNLAVATNSQVDVPLTPQQKFCFLQQESDKQRSHEIDITKLLMATVDKALGGAQQHCSLVVESGMERFQSMVEACDDSADDALAHHQYNDKSSFDTTALAVAANVSDAPVPILDASSKATGGTRALVLKMEGLAGGGADRATSGVADSFLPFSFVANSATKSTPAPADASGVLGANVASNSSVIDTKGGLVDTATGPFVFGAAAAAESESIHHDMKPAASSSTFAFHPVSSPQGGFDFGGHGPKWYKSAESSPAAPNFCIPACNLAADASTNGRNKKRSRDSDDRETKRMNLNN
jgi:hypothetical protein